MLIRMQYVVLSNGREDDNNNNNEKKKVCDDSSHTKYDFEIDIFGDLAFVNIFSHKLRRETKKKKKNLYTFPFSIDIIDV